MDWHTISNGAIEALIDSAATQRTLGSEKSVSELFYERGIAVNTRVNKDLFSGISVVKSFLKSSDGRTRLYIFKTCPNLIREIKAYYWGNGDLPVKRDDHALDELRYYLMHKSSAISLKKQPKSIIQKDKERRFRKIRQQIHL